MSDWLIGVLVFVVIAALIIWLLPTWLFKWIGMGVVAMFVLGVIAKKRMS